MPSTSVPLWLTFPAASTTLWRQSYLPPDPTSDQSMSWWSQYSVVDVRRCFPLCFSLLTAPVSQAMMYPEEAPVSEPAFASFLQQWQAYVAVVQPLVFDGHREFVKADEVWSRLQLSARDPPPARSPPPPVPSWLKMRPPLPLRLPFLLPWKWIPPHLPLFLRSSNLRPQYFFFLPLPLRHLRST